MHILSVAASRIRGVFRRRRRDADLADEFQLHLDLLAQEYRKRGFTSEEAKFAARREFGGLEQTKEAYRDRRGFASIDSMLQDVRIAARGLRKSPVFTVVAISSLALGIGANTAIFSFVNAILLQHLPVPEAQRLVQVREFEGAAEFNKVFSLRMVEEIADRNAIFDGFFGRFPTTVNLDSGGAAQSLMAELVTGQYYQALRVKPAIGRLFGEEDVRTAVANPVCVVSYSTWQERFGGDRSIVGRTLLLNSRPYRVLGVTEPGFRGDQLQSNIEMQIPATRIGDVMPAFAANAKWTDSLTWLQTIGRLKVPLTAAQAEARIQPLFLQLKNGVLRGRDLSTYASLKFLDASQGFDTTRSYFGRPILVLMGVVALVLLVACANLANLLLARASTREKEFAVRLAIGASRGRLIRQLMVESLLIASASGVAGLTISYWVTNSLLLYLNEGKSAFSELHVSPDLTVLCFSAGVSLAAALLFGLAPAWQASRPDLVPGLKGVSCSAAAWRSRAFLKKTLVIAQIGLSLIVLFAAGLLTGTLAALKTVDLGFRPEQVVVLSANPAGNGHSLVETSRIYDEILRRSRAIPGVGAASLSVSTPLDNNPISLDVTVPGYTPRSKYDPPPVFNAVSTGYFSTLNQPFLNGRDFTDRDTGGSPRVAIVNEQFVAHYMPGQSPIGWSFKLGGGEIRIVGVVRNAREQSVRQQPVATIYRPEKQGQTSGLTLLVRTKEDVKRVIPALEATVRNVNSKLAITNVRTLEAQIDTGLSRERILSFLSALFAGLTTLLSGLGVYGVIAYGVSRRRREIGLRLAIGAQRRDVAWLFLRESLMLIATGLFVGIPLALSSAYALRTLLYGLKPTDLATLTAAIALLTFAGLLATAIPIRGAARTDPMRALRHE
jgi:predicted permease